MVSRSKRGLLITRINASIHIKVTNSHFTFYAITDDGYFNFNRPIKYDINNMVWLQPHERYIETYYVRLI